MQTAYLHNAIILKKRKETISKLVKKIKESNIEFDSIAFTGMSGSLIGPIVADMLKKDLILVRKQAENCHSSLFMEMSNEKSKKAIIIDDCIVSGNTIRHIIKNLSRKEIALEGIFLYSEEEIYRKDYKIEDFETQFGVQIENIHGVVK